MNQVAFKPKTLIQFTQSPRIATPAAKDVTLESSAALLLTDFTQVKPQTVDADTSVEEANLKMRYTGVRLLFVNDRDQHCIGLITSREIVGTRRINLAMQQRSLTRDEVTVSMIMTPWNTLSAMPLDKLSALTIEELMRVMEDVTEQHLLVTEYNDKHEVTVRGLVSATDIQNTLGKKLTVVPMARSFADICHVVTGHDL